MRVFVSVVARRGEPDLAAAVDAAAAACLPFRPTAHEQWVSPDGRTLLAAWSNEPDQPDRPLLHVDGDGGGARGASGYVNGEVPPLADVLGDGVDLEIGGVWSLFAAGPDRIGAATCASGAEMVFHAASDDLVVVGNRALLVHLVGHRGAPEPDLVGLAGVLAAGYCVTDRTAYDGVRSLAPATRLTASAAEGRVGLTPYGEGVGVTGAHDVVEALVASVEPLRDLDHPVRLGLTGGRDSRLLVALLTKVGVPLETYTSGLPGDPDVVVAQEVAATLGVTHKVLDPMGASVDDTSVTFDVRSRVREAVVLGEGMLSAYDRVGRVDARYNATTVPFAGSGGEILRAYYAGSLKDPHDGEAVDTFMRSRTHQGVKRLSAEVRAAYDVDTAPWHDTARRRGAAALEDFYVRQRTGRWTGAARGSASIGSLARRPYLDHRVVRAVRGVPLEARVAEHLVADVLDELAPELSEVRFAGRRWKFDEHPPEGAADLAAWEARAPVRGEHGDEATFSWRTDLPEVRRELAALVHAAPPVFWRLVDRARVTEFLARTDDRTRADTMRMWHLATVADALTRDFYAGPARFEETAHEVVAARPAPGRSSGSSSGVPPVRRVARGVVRRARRVLGRRAS